MGILSIPEESDGKINPLSVFDASYHNELNAKYQIASDSNTMALTDHDVILLINTAEQCKRPKDMLKFLSMYFKANLSETDSVHKTINEDKSEGLH